MEFLESSERYTQTTRRFEVSGETPQRPEGLVTVTVFQSAIGLVIKRESPAVFLSEPEIDGGYARGSGTGGLARAHRDGFGLDGGDPAAVRKGHNLVAVDDGGDPAAGRDGHSLGANGDGDDHAALASLLSSQPSNPDRHHLLRLKQRLSILPHFLAQTTENQDQVLQENTGLRQNGPYIRRTDDCHDWPDENVDPREGLAESYLAGFLSSNRRCSIEKCAISRALYEEKARSWSRHIAKLDQQAEDLQERPPLGTPTDRGRFSGDYVNSEAGLDYIMWASARDPVIRAEGTKAALPNMNLDPFAPVFIDTNALIPPDDVTKRFLKTERAWTLEEHSVFLAGLATHNKRFGSISALLTNRSPNDCVLHYYRSKRAAGSEYSFNWKDLLGVKNKDRIRKSSRRFRGRGGLLGKTALDDVIRHSDTWNRSTRTPSVSASPTRISAPSATPGHISSQSMSDRSFERAIMSAKKRGPGRPKRS